MRKWITWCVLLVTLGITAAVIAAVVRPPAGPADRFLAYDVIIDPHARPLAAYQVEITAPAGARIVGVEGGASAAFNAAPYYDPQAITHNRVILGAFSLDKTLPAATTRVARLHLHMVGGPPTIGLTPTLMAAADADGKPIDATLTLQETP